MHLWAPITLRVRAHVRAVIHAHVRVVMRAPARAHDCRRVLMLGCVLSVLG
jgi:hypothetical protein